MTTLVSFVIPAFNREREIPGCLESVQAQTYRDWEAIIVDDGSTDSTVEIVTGFAKRDPRFRLVVGGHAGAQAARNRGIEAAQSEWIAFLDSDDHLLPDSLERRLQIAEQTGCEVVHSECWVLNADSQERQLFGIPPLQGNVYADLLARPGPMYQGMLATKRALTTIGYLDETIRAYQEWETSIRLARRYPFAFSPAPTFVYDCRGDSAISRDLRRGAAGYDQVVAKHRRAILMHAGPRVLSDHYLVSAGQWREAGDLRAAIRRYAIGIALWPYRPRAAIRMLSGLRRLGGVQP